MQRSAVDLGVPGRDNVYGYGRADAYLMYNRLQTSGIEYTINATAGPNGVISPSGNVTVLEGATQNFTITANGGYHIADVIVDGGSVGSPAEYSFVNVTANHTIAASFAADVIPTFTINATAGPNGAIAPSGAVIVTSGADQNFTITPNPGFHIATVLVDNASVGAVASLHVQ